jgi:ribosomal protein S4E
LQFGNLIYFYFFGKKQIMKKESAKLKDGAKCKVMAGTHKGKSGTVRDINTSKTGAVTITVVQSSGVRFKTLAKNVEIV